MRKNMALVSNNQEIAKRELEAGYITYDTLAKRVGSMVLCNNIEQRYGSTLFEESGSLYDDETKDPKEIFQWYIINCNGAEYLKNFPSELVLYDSELDIYVWAITHWGTSWDYVFTDIKATNNVEDLF